MRASHLLKIFPQLLFWVAMVAPGCADAVQFDSISVVKVHPPIGIQDTASHIRDVDATSSRGFLVAGDFGGQQNVTELLSTAGKIEWKNIQDQARTLTSAPDGSFWSVSSDNVVTHYNSAGIPLWHKQPLNPPQFRIDCARGTVDGLVVRGFATQAIPLVDYPNAKPFLLYQPFIAKLGMNGSVQWAQMVPEKSELVFTNNAVVTSDRCQSMSISASGVITTAFSVAKISNALLRGGKIKLPSNPYDNMHESDVVVAQVDKNGGYLRGSISREADKPFLFSLNDKYVLIERIRPTPSESVLRTRNVLGMVAAVETFKKQIGLRFLEFDGSLQPVHQTQFFTPDFVGDLSAVLPLASGGYVLTGCGEDIPMNTIQVYSSHGVRVKVANWVGKHDTVDECASSALMTGESPGTVFLYLRSDTRGEQIGLFKIDANQP